MNDATLAQLFELGSPLVFPFWLLMTFLPHWRWTKAVMRSPLIIIGPAILYVIIVLPNALGIMAEFNPPTLAGVQVLLGTSLGATASWQHFLAFDLFVGRWIYLDSRAHDISAFLVAPCLFLTLMLGPIGFVSYLIIRSLYFVIRDGEWGKALVSPV